MASVEASIEIRAPLAEVWDRYFDQASWPSWVDGFGSVESADGFPAVGGTLRWRSNPAGRGQVTERVREHEPRTHHRVEFEDPGSAGELDVRFEMLPSPEGRATRVTQKQTYRVLTAGPLAPVIDVLFIRSQMRKSLERSLVELRSGLERAPGREARTEPA